MDNSRFWWQAADAPGPGPGPGDPGDPIGKSLRFRGGTGGLVIVSRTTTDNIQADATASFWFKHGMQTDATATFGQSMLLYCPNGVDFRVGNFNDGRFHNGAGYINAITHRDYSAWYHVVLSHDLATSTISTFVNGELLDARSQTFPGAFHSTKFEIGNTDQYASTYFQFDGYIADYHYVNGQALDPTTFGRYNANGVWVPVDPKKDGDTAWYGANGFHLDFADPGDVGKDLSGNNNHFTATGFETTDQTSPLYDIMQDSPTNNFATINPLYPGASTSNANLTTANDTGKPTILGLAGNVHVGGTATAWDGTETGWTFTGDVDFGQRLTPDEISTANMPTDELPDTITGDFTGNNNADGPFVYTGCIPARIQYGSVDVKYQDRLGQTDVDFLSNGFKIRSTTSNSGTVNYIVTTTHDGGEYDGNKVPFQAPAPAVSN